MRTQICEHRVDTIFVNQAQSGAGNTQAHPTIFTLYPKTAVLQIRHESAFGFVVGMGNIVSNHWAFARDFTFTCHFGHSIKRFGMLSTGAEKCLNLTSP
jgi:hypothetical protein